MKNQILSKYLLLVIIISSFFPDLIAQEKESNWGKIFSENNISGTFVLYNQESDNYKFYNKNRADSSFIPASTFKILNSLIALETGVMIDEYETIKWDGKDWGWSEWNKDQNMKSAISISCVWFYQNLARRIGKERMQTWIDSVGYGNSQMGAQIDNFWLEGDLRISANKQIELLKKLINNELPFQKNHQKIVKNIMITDSTNKYIIHSKTGWGLRVKPQIGWYIGYVEKNKNKWIFALNIDIINKSDSKLRKSITYEILKSEGIID